MMRREPAVAGQFYPGDPEELRAEISSYLEQVTEPKPPPKALIGPHAGTIYSGPVAAYAYATLRPMRDQIKRVILLGPSHWVAVEGMAASHADVFLTPLGEIPVDQTIVKKMTEFSQVDYIDEAHLQEHSLELHLPFLQEVLADFSLIPLVVGMTKPEAITEVLESAWGGSETLIVVSTDLSHYHPYAEAQQIDRATTKAIEQLRWEDLQHDQACGFYPVRGLLEAARQHRMKVTTVDLRNSGDTTGTREGVVGYGSYLFSES